VCEESCSDGTGGWLRTWMPLLLRDTFSRFFCEEIRLPILRSFFLHLTLPLAAFVCSRHNCRDTPQMDVVATAGREFEGGASGGALRVRRSLRGCFLRAGLSVLNERATRGEKGLKPADWVARAGLLCAAALSAVTRLLLFCLAPLCCSTHCRSRDDWDKGAAGRGGFSGARMTKFLPPALLGAARCFIGGPQSWGSFDVGVDALADSLAHACLQRCSRRALRCLSSPP
jgi:hypothetical protein